ncbi:hypothetical protein N7517_005786 [Penicillium concentricum]|uniref:Mid2 domain-containing protein n=1 Tax=Penicillium concentricum TaxID=293559 RepID=A0A9W9VBT8_9EURO|nr:uncharacterized protein N7517_005786 [Penicillium concentricum]KAJ5373780.1 hypothetical protein N7517_005786 [Penicillium concentricum]
MIRVRGILRLLLFQAVLPTIVQSRQCYLTNGKAADSSFQPCFPDQDDSPCCSLAKSNTTPNDICLSGGVCYIQDPNFRGLLRQGACTDKTWKSGQCPELCDTVSDATLYVIPCPLQGRGFWCCSVNGTNCCDDAVRLDMGQMINVSVTSLTSEISSSSGSSKSALSSSVSSVSPSPKASSSSPSSTNANTDTETNTKTNPKDTTCTPGSNTSATCPASKTTVISAGLGAGLGGCLLIAIVTMVVQRRIYKKNLRQKEAMIDEIAAASSAQHLGYPYAGRDKIMFPAELGPRDTRIHEVEGNGLNEK